METKKEYPEIAHFLAREYAFYFLGGLEGIDRKRQARLNEIEDKFEEMGFKWKDWSELVMAHFDKLEKDLDGKISLI